MLCHLLLQHRRLILHSGNREQMKTPPEIASVEVTADNTWAGEAPGVSPNGRELLPFSCAVNSIVKMRIDHPYSSRGAVDNGGERDAGRRADMQIISGQPNHINAGKRIPA